MDASTTTADSGVAGDAATPDSGTEDPDAGVAIEDAATPDPDGGVPEPDAGPVELSCEMGTIRIQETCPAFTACGGDEVGSWCYADVCMTKDELLAPVVAQAMAFLPACMVDDVEVRGSMGTIDGMATLTGSMLTRTVTSSATGTFYLGPDCVFLNCMFMEMEINRALGDSGMATCTPDGDGCECDITFDSMVNESDTYTLDGNTIVTGSDRRYDYCVGSDGNFRFKEDASMRSGSGEPGTQTLLPLSP